MKFSELETICTKATIETYGKNVEYKRLFKCSAYFYVTENFLILRSYRTIVAIYDNRDNKLYDFLRVVYGYTSISCQHIRKFRHMIECANHGIPVEYICIHE